MKTLILAAALLPLLTSVTAQSGPGYVGCYKSSGSLAQKGTEASNSPSACRDSCAEAGGSTVEAMTKTTECYCGASLPPSSDKAEDPKCDASCPGSTSDTCGSKAGDFFSVYLTGVNPSPPVDTNNNTATATTGSRNNTTSTTTDRSSETSTSGPTDTNKPKSTTSTGEAASRTSGSTTSSTRSPNSGDSVHIGGGALVGVVMGVLAMIF